jgi:hypothetical protein
MRLMQIPVGGGDGFLSRIAWDVGHSDGAERFVSEIRK